jgi:hypothetical protein
MLCDGRVHTNKQSNKRTLTATQTTHNHTLVSAKLRQIECYTGFASGQTGNCDNQIYCLHTYTCQLIPFDLIGMIPEAIFLVAYSLPPAHAISTLPLFILLFIYPSLLHLFFCCVHFCIDDVFQPNKLEIIK